MGKIIKNKLKEIIGSPVFDIYVRKYNDFHHKRVMEKIKPLLNMAYNDLVTHKIILSKRENKEDTIWFFWWQGEKNLTNLGKKCLKSIIQNRGKRKVVVISKYNVKKYVNIPSYIYIKLKQNKITLTHFSDVVRVNLLKDYGGLWLDSTIYLTKPLDDVKIGDLFTISFDFNFDKRNNYISKCQWSSFCLGGSQNESLYVFLSHFYNLYWNKYSKIIDYFLLDYILRFAWDRDIDQFPEKIRKYIDYAPKLYCLINLLNKKYNKKKFDEITNNNNVFKLSNGIKIYSGDTFFYHL